MLPDGFMVELEPLADPAVLPVALPLPLMVLPLDPVVPELVPMELPPPIPAAPPPAPPPAPPAPPPAANASVEPSVRIEAKAIVVSFLCCPFTFLNRTTSDFALSFQSHLLGILKQEYQKKSDDRGAGIYHRLPCITVSERPAP